MQHVWTEAQTNLVFVVAGLLKLALVTLFFASFLFVPHAQSQSVENCSGNNLMEQFKLEKPEVYASINSAAAKEINGRSVFWKIEKEGLPTSYLFGTMHLSDPQIAILPNDVKEAIANSDQMVVEAVDALDPKKAQETMAKLSHLTFLQDGTLRDLVKDELEDALVAALAERGLPIQFADRMQPWLVATMVALPVCEMRRKQSGEKVLDSVLVESASELGKPLLGLETAKEQFEAIASLPQEYHVSALEETLASGKGSLDMIETLKVLYQEGNIGAVFPLMRAAMPESATGAGAARFQEQLVEKRNLNMAERLLPMLESASNFVAVGALHLPGKTGLVEELRQAGFNVTTLR